MRTQTPTRIITGASRGFGRAITEHALECGDNVLAAVRRPEAVADLLDRHPQRFAVEDVVAGTDDRVEDVVAGTDDRVEDVVATALQRFGRIDAPLLRPGWPGRRRSRRRGPSFLFGRDDPAVGVRHTDALSSMGIRDLQHYIALVDAGDGTIDERLDMLLEHRDTIRRQLRELTLSMAATGYKIATYGERTSDYAASTASSAE